MEIPWISLIIPTHLRGQYLKRALESVNLQKHRHNIEVIVISDLSDEVTDNVARLLLGENDVYIRRNGLCGPAESRNLGLQLAKGKFVMFLDDDDAWHPDFSSELFKKINDLSVNVAYMNCVVVKESRHKTGPKKISEVEMNLNGLLNFDVYVKNQVHMSCYLFSKNIVRGLLFDSTLRGYEDWDFQLAVIDREMPTHLPIICSYVYEVDDATTDRRGASAGATGFNAVLDYLTIYRRHIAPDEITRIKRTKLLDFAGLSINQSFL
jgi:glycosyltransferase involved in cell wall biosynthesis